MDPRKYKGKAREADMGDTSRRPGTGSTLRRTISAFDPIDDLLQDLDRPVPQDLDSPLSQDSDRPLLQYLDSPLSQTSEVVSEVDDTRDPNDRARSIVRQIGLNFAEAYYASKAHSQSQDQGRQSYPHPVDDEDDFWMQDNVTSAGGMSSKARGKLPERLRDPAPHAHDRGLPRKADGSGVVGNAAARPREREGGHGGGGGGSSSRNNNNPSGGDRPPLLSFAQRAGSPHAPRLPPPSPPRPLSPPLPPSTPPPPPHSILPSPPAHQPHLFALTPPCDLPTQTYAAIIQNPGFDLYLDYPTRIHHLRHPGDDAPRAAIGDDGASAGMTMAWEDLYLRQRVSCPRIHARWARPLTPADRARMARFLRFYDDSPYAPSPTPSPTPSPRAPASAVLKAPTTLGLRPHRDILHLDASYVAALLGRQAAARRLLAHFDPAVELLPFVARGDRHKITTLAVSAEAFFGYHAHHHHPQQHLDPAALAPRLCEILAAALPALGRLLLVSTAVVDRPPSAAWDLEAEFARWARLADVVALEQQQQQQTNQNRNQEEGPVARRARETSPLPRAVETAYATALRTVLPARAVRLAAIRGKTSASRIARPKQQQQTHAHAHTTKPKAREGGGGGKWTTLPPPPPSPVTEDEARFEVSDLSSTESVVSGGGRSDEEDEMGGSGGPWPLTVEPFVLLYYRDAFERAVAQGWTHDELLPVDHIDLGLE